MFIAEDKLYVDYADVEKMVLQIGREIALSDWKPDYIVGITRGGLLPATLLSQFLNVPMSSLDVSLRDNALHGPESNCWMAEEAYGYVESGVREVGPDAPPVPTQASFEFDRDYETSSSPSKRKNILIVDDINDSGATFNWIIEDWQTGCLPHSPVWDEVFGNNVRTFALVTNEASEFKDINYAGHVINKNEDDLWVVFPWEEWWLHTC